MKLEQSVVIDAEAGRVWELLREPESAAECVPGVRLQGRDEEDRYLGDLTVRFGPTRVAFSGAAEINLDSEDLAGTIVARGADRHGRSRATGTLRFHLVPGGRSVELVSSADVTVTGALASFAESGGRHIAEQLLAGLAENVAARLRQDAGQPGTDAPVPAAPPPHLSLRRTLAAWLARLFQRQ